MQNAPLLRKSYRVKRVTRHHATGSAVSYVLANSRRPICTLAVADVPAVRLALAILRGA